MADGTRAPRTDLTGESVDPAALAAAVLDDSDLRAGARGFVDPHAPDRDDVDDATLPGVGDDTMSLRDALRSGGTAMVALIGLAQFVEWIDRSAFNVLAPDIQKTLGVSDAVLGAIGGAFGVLFFAGSIPISSLADRRSRTKLAAVAIGVWSVMVACTGLVQNAFQLFLARLGSGLGQSYQLPVNSPLLIDAYPMQARARVFALSSGMQMVGQGLAPFLAGAIAALVGGDEGWRVVFLVTAVAAVPVALLTARLRDPKRGRNEMQAVLGEELASDAEDEIPISLGVAFERLRRIRTFYFFLLGMAALGFALFSVPLFLNLLLEDRFGLDAFDRGLLAALVAIPGVLAVGVVGRRIDGLFRESPPRSLVFIGTLVAAFGVFIAIGVFMPNVVLLGIFVAIGTALSASVFGVIVAPLSAVIPYRLRSRGVALVGIYIFLFGGFFGAVITGLLSDEIGTRGAIALVVVPSALLGGALIAYGARHIRGDMAAVVEELEEERDELRRVSQATDATPVIQVRNLDFSYGKVQVLFDVDLEVRRGETLALLGTNGAGKSTLLRVVSGLGVAQRGVVRFNGRTVTYADPELRVKIGIVQLMGGKAVFPPLTVAENLRMAGYLYSGADLRRRVDSVLAQFPVLAERRATAAGDLSGGQQQILALAMTLIHEPEVLIVDELSLGLAPVVVQELLGVVERLKADGLTMIIVEQSLNVALAVADRAVFMEKGQVRFEGAARELLERDDLARAVFLGRVTAVLAFALPGQVLFNGVVLGLTYGILAIGVILVFRSSRVINFAIAEMGAFGAVLLARLVVNWDVPFLVAFAACVVVGGLIGAAIELGVVRRLFEAPRVILLVATIGVAQVLLFAEFSLPELSRYTDYPSPITESWHVGDVIVRGSQILVLVVVPLLTGALAYFSNRTKTGIAIRASAANADAARLAGIDIKRMSTLVWVLAGVLATVGAILTAPLNSATANDVGVFGPALLLRVLAAALIGRMVSLPWAVAGGVAIGVAETTLFYNYPNQLGLLDMVLLVVVLVTLLPLARGGRLAGDSGRWSFSPRVRPIPVRLERVWWVRRLPILGALAALVVALVPLVVLSSASDQFLFSRVLLYAIVALSVTVLTGWTGQLSLGQFAIVGVGAMSTASLVGRGLGFVPAVLLAAVIAAVIAMVIGAPALRMPGLFLAVVTLAFAVAAPAWLLGQDVFTRGEDFVFMPRAVIGPVDLSSQGTYYVVCLVVLVLVVIGVARVRRSGFGRSLIAVRDNERGAAALGLSPTRIKLTAFAIAGALAGLAGGLLAGLLVQFDPGRFSATESLSVVAIAVIGGLASIPGAILGALWVVGLPSIFTDSSEVALLTSGAGLLVLLLYFPGGLIQVFYSARDALFDVVARRLEAADAAASGDTGDTGAPRRGADRTARTGSGAGDDHARVPRPGPEVVPVAIRVDGLTVAYGRRTVVDDVALEVRTGETVGLIGANGAGKSTLMNAVGGFVPSRGRIELLGHDVARVSPARRARRGLGRSFQGAELFSDLTVRETVQLAIEPRDHASLATVVLGLPKARRVERSKRADADEIVAFLGLGAFANRFVDELSTGTRRIVELACLVASGAQVLCLDEPTAGIAQRETEAFGPLVLRIRAELDATLLVIEHDMPLVMGISDRVYCLEAGRVICEGPPDTVRNDSRVIASYLGTDERAIARSGELSGSAPVTGPPPVRS